jgi:hypothetical protein
MPAAGVKAAVARHPGLAGSAAATHSPSVGGRSS